MPARSHLWSVMGRLFFVFSVTVLALTTRSTVAFADARDCVRLVRSTESHHLVVLAGSCDLRWAANRFPQTTQAGSAMRLEQQLRSIYAANADEKPSSPVRMSCIHSARPADAASPEELAFCPKGLVNYYAIAGAQLRIPLSQQETYGEKASRVARTACRALDGTHQALAAQRADLSAGAKLALAVCRSESASAGLVADEEKPSVADWAVALPTPETVVVASPAPVLVPSQPSVPMSSPTPDGPLSVVLAGIIVVLLGVNVVQWWRHRGQVVRNLNGQKIVVGRGDLDRAIRAVQIEMQKKVDAIQASHGSNLQDKVAALQAVEAEYQRAVQALRNAMQRRLAQRDLSVAELERANTKLRRELASIRNSSVRQEKRMATLRARLRLAKHGDDPYAGFSPLDRQHKAPA